MTWIATKSSNNLARIGKAANGVMRTDTLEAVAHRGYFNSREILECHEAGVTMMLPEPVTSGARRLGGSASVTLPLRAECQS
jgi:hypothetical protein